MNHKQSYFIINQFLVPLSIAVDEIDSFVGKLKTNNEKGFVS